MNNVAPPPSLASYDQQLLEDAKLSPETQKKTVQQVSYILQDELLHQDSQQLSYDSTKSPQFTIVYRGTEHASEESNDEQGTLDSIQQVPPTNKRK